MTKAEKLNITEFPYSEYDDNENETYHESNDGRWFKTEYDDNDQVTRREYSNGSWYTFKFNDKGLELSSSDSYGNLKECKYDELDRRIYFSNRYNTKQSLRSILNNPKKKFVSKRVFYEGKIEYDMFDRVISYEDSDGNFWKESMGVESPYKQCYSTWVYDLDKINLESDYNEYT